MKITHVPMPLLNMCDYNSQIPKLGIHVEICLIYNTLAPLVTTIPAFASLTIR